MNTQSFKPACFLYANLAVDRDVQQNPVSENQDGSSEQLSHFLKFIDRNIL